MWAFQSIWKMLFFIVLQVLIIKKILTSNKIAPTCFICCNSQIFRNSQSWLCSCWYHNTVIGIWSNMIWYIEGEGGRISQFIQYLLRSVTCERKFDLEKVTTDKSFNPFHATPRFLYPLKTSENQGFSDVFRGYIKRPVAWNGSISDLNNSCSKKIEKMSGTTGCNLTKRNSI